MKTIDGLKLEWPPELVTDLLLIGKYEGVRCLVCKRCGWYIEVEAKKSEVEGEEITEDEIDQLAEHYNQAHLFPYSF